MKTRAGAPASAVVRLRAPDHEPARLVRGPGGRRCRLRAPDGGRVPRDDDGRTEVAEAVAAFRARGRAPLRWAARRQLRRDPCRDDRRRRLPALLAHRARRAVHGELPADLHCARGSRGRAVARARGDQPLSLAAPAYVLAARALPQPRGLERGDRPRARQRHRQEHAVVAGDFRRLGRDRPRHGRVAGAPSAGSSVARRGGGRGVRLRRRRRGRRRRDRSAPLLSQAVECALVPGDARRAGRARRGSDPGARLGSRDGQRPTARPPARRSVGRAESDSTPPRSSSSTFPAGFSASGG